MSARFQYPRSLKPPTWDQFKAAVRRVDRDSLLVQAARASSTIAQGDDPEHWKVNGLTPWNIADVARTALAWASDAPQDADLATLTRLCNMNAQLADEVNDPHDGSSERISRMLTRITFEQFSGQRSVMQEAARTLLLFGDAAQLPPEFVPKTMVPDWFATMMDGLTLEAYVESVLLIAIIAEGSGGAFSLDWIDTPPLSELQDVFVREDIRRTFIDHLLTTAEDFKRENRRHQDSVGAAQKKYAFNTLAAKPFISGVASTPLAPWVQSVIAKALPPAIYHVAWPTLGDGFTHDLGTVFQEYTGRQLSTVGGEGQALPEVAYGPKRNRLDSCDWFLDLPGLLVLIECKARQPNEALRTRGENWLGSITASIGKGIQQLNRSHEHIDQISSACPQIDPMKPRVGIVVTFEPFYVNQNWHMWEHLEPSSFPVGVASIGELESLVTLGADELARLLLEAAAAARGSEALDGNLLLLNPALNAANGRENTLLVSTWRSIGLFDRIRRASDHLRAAHPAQPHVVSAS